MNLTKDQKDFLKEILNIGVGRSGAVLGELLGTSVRLEVPDVGICKSEELHENLKAFNRGEISCVTQSFSGIVSGEALLAFPKVSGTLLTRRLVGDDLNESDIDSEREITLSEVGNIIMNSLLGTLAKLFYSHFEFQLPVYSESPLNTLLSDIAEKKSCGEPLNYVVYGNAHFEVEQLKVIGTILVMFELTQLEKLIGAAGKAGMEKISR
jgi:chemotaxis protein CheC